MDALTYITEGRKAFLVGIGGISMRALADVLAKRGLIVSGSDLRASEATDRLISGGIPVYIGHAPEHVHGADCVIRTAAAHDDNPEIQEARRLGIPVFERAEAWGAIMRGSDSVVCISGTHGKTTTTAMLVQIAVEAGRDPTAMIGGILPSIGSEHLIGGSGLFIAEACEYRNSFLSFYPTIAAILNVEEDHPDFFPTLADIIKSFKIFAALTPEEGTVIVNRDSENAMACVEGLERSILTFGLHEGDVHAENLVWDRGRAVFDILHPGGLIPIKLKVPGTHNVANALAAAACALEAGIDGISIARGLGSFTGAKRRLEYKGNYRGTEVYDDYAHHPTEIGSLIDGVRGMGFSRVVGVFQPHTFSRTKALFDDFATQLKRLDRAVILPVFSAAREKDTGEVSSEMLAEAAGCETADSMEAAAALLRDYLREGDVLLTIGAGDAYMVGDILLGENL